MYLLSGRAWPGFGQEVLWESMFAEVLAFLEGKRRINGHPDVTAISINRYTTLIWFLLFLLGLSFLIF